MPKTKSKPESLRLWWIADRDLFRIWRSDWHGDQFEVVDTDEFDATQRVAKMFSIPMQEWLDD